MVSKDTENNTLSTNEFTNKDNKIKSRVKKNKNLFKISELFSLIIITMIVSLTLGYFLGQRMNGTTKLSDEMKKFINDYNEIKENYYEEVQNIVNDMYNIIGG